MIGQTIDWLCRQFPAVQLWVIDNDSNDDTATVVRSRMIEDDRIHLVSRCRPVAHTGKGEALNSA